MKFQTPPAAPPLEGRGVAAGMIAARMDHGDRLFEVNSTNSFKNPLDFFAIVNITNLKKIMIQTKIIPILARLDPLVIA